MLAMINLGVCREEGLVESFTPAARVQTRLILLIRGARIKENCVSIVQTVSQ